MADFENENAKVDTLTIRQDAFLRFASALATSEQIKPSDVSALIELADMLTDAAMIRLRLFDAGMPRYAYSGKKNQC